MTDDQKQLLGVDREKIKASRLRAPLVIVTSAAGILVAMTITVMKGGTCTFALHGFESLNFWIYFAFVIAFALI